MLSISVYRRPPCLLRGRYPPCFSSLCLSFALQLICHIIHVCSSFSFIMEPRIIFPSVLSVFWVKKKLDLISHASVLLFHAPKLSLLVCHLNTKVMFNLLLLYFKIFLYRLQRGMERKRERETSTVRGNRGPSASGALPAGVGPATQAGARNGSPTRDPSELGRRSIRRATGQGESLASWSSVDFYF